MKRPPIDTVPRQVSCSREISHKKKMQKAAKSFVHNIAKQCFGSRCKSIIIRNRPRKAELAYKVRVVGKNTTDSITRFNQEVLSKTEHYTLEFSGSFNPRTGREELFIDLVLFGDIQTPLEGTVHEKNTTGERGNNECSPLATSKVGTRFSDEFACG